MPELAIAPAGRADPEVRRLYEAFIHEADGPLPAGVVDLEAEAAAGPPRTSSPPTGCCWSRAPVAGRSPWAASATWAPRWPR